MTSNLSAAVAEWPAPINVIATDGVIGLIECVKTDRTLSDMRATARSVGDFTVFEIMGRLDAETSLGAEDLLIELIEQGNAKIVINLEMLQYINSRGFRFLMLAAKWAKDAGGSMRICGVSGKVKELFAISGFSTTFRVYANEAIALSDS
jgi:anti-sigma B factor antagonist